MIQLPLSYEYWIYRERPRADGADARFWMAELLSLHVRFCVQHGAKMPSQPIPIGDIGPQFGAASPSKRNLNAALGLAWICGHPPRQEYKLTIETLVAKVFVEGTCGPDVSKAAEVLRRHIKEGTPWFDLTVLVEIAVVVAIAEGFRAINDEAECQRWLEVARDDAVHDHRLQALLRDAIRQRTSIDVNKLLFPRTTPGKLLEGCRDSSS